MFRKKNVLLSALLILNLGFMFLSLQGCEPLRKKFHREKKKSDNERLAKLPVLEPMEYPDKYHSPGEVYQQHFSSWKVWQDEFIKAIELRDTDKRQKYFLAQAIAQLEEMKKLVVDEKKMLIDQSIEVFMKALNDMDKPEQMRNDYLIKTSIERVGKTIRETLNSKSMENYYISSL